ncbi:hypothetical protein [Pectinatus frisingensis]|uniref:hypothetical protein n=1 Tax=Pectinatus frisingensis TaxID=865 RepID=UPI003D808FC9
MKSYIGIKLIKAEPMNRGDYNKYRGWPIPMDENPADKGYLIKQDTGHETWQPKKEFENDYELAENMIVSTGDNIARKNDDNTLTPYEVILADTSKFIIVPVNIDGSTGFDNLEAYSNDKTINTLEKLDFIKLEDK